MTAVRYRVPDLPTAGAGAFLPTPVTRAELSSWGLVSVRGAPGTLSVPSPKPSTSNIRAGQQGQTVDDKTISSFDSPDVFFPSIYVPGTENQGPQRGALGINVRIHNDVPAPAINVIRAPAVAQTPPTKLGGRRVTPWPRAFQRFPTVAQPSATGRALW